MVKLLSMLHLTMVDPTITTRVDLATIIRVGMYPTPTRLPPKNMYKAQ